MNKIENIKKICIFSRVAMFPFELWKKCEIAYGNCLSRGVICPATVPFSLFWDILTNPNIAILSEVFTVGTVVNRPGKTNMNNVVFQVYSTVPFEGNLTGMIEKGLELGLSHDKGIGSYDWDDEPELGDVGVVPCDVVISSSPFTEDENVVVAKTRCGDISVDGHPNLLNMEYFYPVFCEMKKQCQEII